MKGKFITLSDEIFGICRCNTHDNYNMEEESKGIYLVCMALDVTGSGKILTLSILWKIISEYCDF